MQIPGRLSASTLGNLLGLLHRSRTTGLLELCEPCGRRHRVHLSCGLVVGIDTSARVAPLGELLSREGFLSAPALRRLMSKLAGGDPRRAGEILVSEGLIHGEVVDAALLAQLREKLEALFRIAEAAVRFHTARPVDASRRGAPLPPRDFLHGRPRKRDGARAAASRPTAPPSGPARAAAPTDSPLDDERARALLVLGLPRSAGPDDVRRAFRRLAGRLHPDRLVAAAEADRQRSTALFARLSAAYHTLVA